MALGVYRTCIAEARQRRSEIPPSDGPLKVFGHPTDGVASQVNGPQHLQAAHQVNHLLDCRIWEEVVTACGFSLEPHLHVHGVDVLVGWWVVSQILKRVYQCHLNWYVVSSHKLLWCKALPR